MLETISNLESKGIFIQVDRMYQHDHTRVWFINSKGEDIGSGGRGDTFLEALKEALKDVNLLILGYYESNRT